MVDTKSLTKEETNLYFQYLKEGQQEYRDKIIVGNYRLVIHLALKYVSSEYELDDLVSIGTIGLIKAVDSFDLDKKISFATYASRCVINEIFMSFRHKKNWISLDDTSYIERGDKDIPLIEFLSDDKNMEQMIIDNVTFQENKVALIKILKHIDSRKRQILLDYYGIGCSPLSQNELSIKYEISQSGIAKLLGKTLKDLKILMNLDEEINSLQKLLTKK